MKKVVIIFCSIMIPVLLLCELACGQTVRLRVELDQQGQGNGTAVCIGHTPEGYSVFLTAKHNFRGARGGEIFHDGRWIAAEAINQHPSEDVLSFEAAADVPALQLADAEQIGETVEIRYGPEYHGRKASVLGKPWKQAMWLAVMGFIHPAILAGLYFRMKRSGIISGHKRQ